MTPPIGTRCAATLRRHKINLPHGLTYSGVAKVINRIQRMNRGGESVKALRSLPCICFLSGAMVAQAPEMPWMCFSGMIIYFAASVWTGRFAGKLEDAK